MEEINRKIIEPKVLLIEYNNPNPKKIRKSLYVFNFKFKKKPFKNIIYSIYHYKLIQRNL